MTTLNFQEIATFIEVANHQSLSNAAIALRVSTATVSRRLSRLEERLGARLVDRSTRSLMLTDAGRKYLGAAGKGLELIMDAENDVQEMFQEPKGQLRVAAPGIFVRHQLGEIAIRYARHFPGVELHVFEADERVDFDAQEVDIAIQVLPPSKWEVQGVRSTRQLTRKSLGTLRIFLVASPKYVSANPEITHPEQLADHRCIVQGANPSARFVKFYHEDGIEHAVEVSMGIFTTSVAFCRRACVDGIGLTGLTEPDCKHLIQRGELVRLLPEWEMEPVRCVVTFVEGPKPPQRIRAFLNLCDQLMSF